VLSRVAGGSVGGFSCLVTGPASTSSFDIEDSPRSVASPVAGTTYNFSASVRSDASVGKAYIRIMEYVNGVKVAQLDSPQATLSTSWQRLQVSYVATGTGSNLYFTVKDSPVAVSETFNVDDMSACAGASPATITAEDNGVAAAAPEFIAPTVKPNPVGRQATLTFSTSRFGPLQVELYDVSGRRVRSLISDANAAAGIHALPLDGARLGSGVFFYRIRSVDGSSQGRFLIMN